MSNRVKGRPLPCPFCGSMDVHLREVAMPDGKKVHRVLCKNCWASGGIALEAAAGLTLWNSRVEVTEVSVTDN